MNYSALERFKGAWIGSIIGDALSSKIDASDYHKIIQYRLKDWIYARDEIARITIDNQSLELAIISSLEILSQYSLNNLQPDFTESATNNSIDALQKSKTDSINYCCNVMSILLSIIVFQQSDRDVRVLYRKIVERYYKSQVNIIEIEQEIALWSDLIGALLNHKFQLDEANVSMTLDRILSGVRVKSTSLIAKLAIVRQAWERGFSLQQLADTLEAKENVQKETIATAGSAIALSLYCFVSTPKNFMLSVKRAAKLDNRLSIPVTILTASLSGAYNGIGGIPKNWLIAASHHQFYALAGETVIKLFAIWSGVDNPNNIEKFYSLGINSVAAAGVLQPRHTLKIISQKSSLS